MSDSSNSTALSRRQALGVVAGAVIGAMAPAGANESFDASGWVRLWEDVGNVVYFDHNRSGQEMIGIYCPDGSRWPDWTAIRRWNKIETNTPEWRENIIGYLKARGTRPGYPSLRLSI